MSITGVLSLLASVAGASNLNFEFPADSSTPVPFQPSVDPGFIEETRLKASRYRASIELLDEDSVNSGWREGPPVANMTAIAQYWSNEYDWAEAQEEITGNFSHFAVTLPSAGDYKHPIPLHFVHERSEADDAIPLLLLHGWPSSHREWSKVIDPLVASTNASAQAFHIVAPDLPGYGFSPASTYSGLDAPQIGAALDQLMGQLGYEKYGVVGTDLGWIVGLLMATQNPENVIGYFSDFWLVSPNATDLERYAQNQTTEEETRYIEASLDWSNNYFSYSDAHIQTPLAIANAMSDSPVGFAGWIWHLVHWVNNGYEYTLKELITNTLLLFIQGTYGNIRLYKQTLPLISELEYVTVPTCASLWSLSNGPIPTFGVDQSPPLEWIQRMANVTFLSRHDNGGHFPAQTEPELWTRDVREFFGGLKV